MAINVTKEMAVLQEMTTRELQEKYREVFGERITIKRGRIWM